MAVRHGALRPHEWFKCAIFFFSFFISQSNCRMRIYVIMCFYSRSSHHFKVILSNLFVANCGHSFLYYLSLIWSIPIKISHFNYLMHSFYLSIYTDSLLIKLNSLISHSLIFIQSLLTPIWFNVQCRIYVSDDDISFWEEKEVRPTLTIDSMRDVLRTFINGQLIGN